MATEWQDPGLRELAAAGGFGMLGRALHFVREDKRPLGWRLWIWELPVALAMGIMGRGIADLMGWDGFPEYSTMIAAGYLGPRIVDLLIEIIRRRNNL